MDSGDKQTDLTNVDQIALLNSTLEKALERQRDILMDEFESRFTNTSKKSHVTSFTFRSEGLRMQPLL